MFRESKDAALAFAAKSFLNGKLRGIGEVVDLSLDTREHAIAVRVQLLGDAEPIDVHVTRYAIERRGDEAILTIGDATASRQWVASVLRDFVIGRRFVIPPKVAPFLSVLT